MKNTSITFHAKSNCNDNLDCQDMVSRLIETKGSEEQFPKFGFESSDVWWPYSEYYYGVRSDFERVGRSKFEFRGVTVIFDPSQSMVGHSLLPNNDMDSTRRLAFRMLQHVLEEHFHDDDHPFIKLFDQYHATVNVASMAFYMPFQSHEAARKGLHAVVSHLEQSYSDQAPPGAVFHGQPTCQGTLNDTVWSVCSEQGMNLRLYVPNDPNSELIFCGAIGMNDEYRAKLLEPILGFARSVLVIEADLGPGWLTSRSLSNPLVWDLPSVDVYAFVCREVKRGLALNKIAGMAISVQPDFPKTVVEATFNRQTGMAYFNR